MRIARGRQLDLLGRLELDAALAGLLAPLPRPGETRLRELGHLASLLAARARFAGIPLGPGRHS